MNYSFSFRLVNSLAILSNHCQIIVWLMLFYPPVMTKGQWSYPLTNLHCLGVYFFFTFLVNGLFQLKFAARLKPLH